jgi:heme/copper-type cytochrome/quinol oxidase subunit 2
MMDGPNLSFVPAKEDSDAKFFDELFIIMIAIGIYIFVTVS